MNLENLEFAIIVIGCLIILGAVIEVYQLLTRHTEVKRQRFLEETRAHRMNQTNGHGDGTMGR